mmetsp:Transcript_33662/g.94712  ORF Transcript_33662/g.94712 Transcript_33662/m.94712 type:complete len:430 (+) Transcript_33662:879-2168(+)
MVVHAVLVLVAKVKVHRTEGAKRQPVPRHPGQLAPVLGAAPAERPYRGPAHQLSQLVHQHHVVRRGCRNPTAWVVLQLWRHRQRDRIRRMVIRRMVETKEFLRGPAAAPSPRHRGHPDLSVQPRLGSRGCRSQKCDAAPTKTIEKIPARRVSTHTGNQRCAQPQPREVARYVPRCPRTCVPAPVVHNRYARFQALPGSHPVVVYIQRRVPHDEHRSPDIPYCFQDLRRRRSPPCAGLLLPIRIPSSACREGVLQTKGQEPPCRSCRPHSARSGPRRGRGRSFPCHRWCRSLCQDLLHAGGQLHSWGLRQHLPHALVQRAIGVTDPPVKVRKGELVSRRASYVRLRGLIGPDYEDTKVRRCARQVGGARVHGDENGGYIHEAKEVVHVVCPRKVAQENEVKAGERLHRPRHELKSFLRRLHVWKRCRNCS